VPAVPVRGASCAGAAAASPFRPFLCNAAFEELY
jgi:hypothetical protein